MAMATGAGMRLTGPPCRRRRPARGGRASSREGELPERDQRGLSRLTKSGALFVERECALVRDPHQHGDQGVIGEERRSAVRDERQGDPREGQESQDAGDDQKRLETEEQREAGGQQAGEVRTSNLGDPETGADDQRRR